MFYSRINKQLQCVDYLKNSLTSICNGTEAGFRHKHFIEVICYTLVQFDLYLFQDGGPYQELTTY